MPEKVLAAVKVAPMKTELRELAMPDIPADAALLKVEAAGVCGSDVGGYQRELRGGPTIMGHENVGVLVKVGSAYGSRWGVKEGDLVALEEYLPCGSCEWCRIGEYRHCWATDPTVEGSTRYGATPITVGHGLWGGFSQYLYVPPNAPVHKVPAGATALEAAMALPVGNGIQWAIVEGEAGIGKTVLIQGPGQQGLACVVAAKAAGAETVIVTGLSRDARRLEVAKQLGADVTIDIERDDPRQVIRDLTNGYGVDTSVDTAGGGPATTQLAVDVLKRKAGIMVFQGGETSALYDGFPIGRVARKYIQMRPARGHSFNSVEMGLRWIASHRFPLHLLQTHHFGLKDVDWAIRSTGGTGAEGAIHVTVLPWE